MKPAATVTRLAYQPLLLKWLSSRFDECCASIAAMSTEMELANAIMRARHSCESSLSGVSLASSNQLAANAWRLAVWNVLADLPRVLESRGLRIYSLQPAKADAVHVLKIWVCQVEVQSAPISFLWPECFSLQFACRI